MGQSREGVSSRNSDRRETCKVSVIDKWRKCPTMVKMMRRVKRNINKWVGEESTTRSSKQEKELDRKQQGGNRGSESTRGTDLEKARSSQSGTKDDKTKLHRQVAGETQHKRVFPQLQVRGGGNVGTEYAGWKTNGSTTGKKKICKSSFQMA